MLQRDVTIRNKLGLHARAAAKLVHLANRYQAAVRLRRENQEVNAKSILGILLLAAAPGTVIQLVCEGSDEEQAMTALVQLIDDRFDEESTGAPS